MRSQFQLYLTQFISNMRKNVNHNRRPHAAFVIYPRKLLHYIQANSKEALGVRKTIFATESLPIRNL